MLNYVERSHQNDKLSLNIAHILPLDQKGGMENGVINIVNHLQERNICFDIFLLSTDNSIIKQWLKPTIGVYAIPKKQNGFDYFLPIKLAKLLKSRNIDIVHTHNWGTFFHGVAAAKLAGISRIIHGEHGFNFHELEPESAKRRLLKKILSKQVHKIVTMSKDLETHWQLNYGIQTNKLITIYNGVNIEKFTPYTPPKKIRRQYLKGNGPIVGTAGRLDEIKNFPLLIDVIHDLRKRFPEIVCLIVGEGPQRTLLRKRIQDLDLKKNVVMTGFIQDMVDLYNLMDVFVLPSYMEGLSNTLLEAMACEVPVIATDIGGNKELIKHGYNGLLFAVNDKDALKENLELILERKIYVDRMVQNAKRNIIENFSLKKMLDKYKELYLSTKKNK